MIREVIANFIFLLVLAVICCSFVGVQKNSVKQIERSERIIEETNAYY